MSSISIIHSVAYSHTKVLSILNVMFSVSLTALESFRTAINYLASESLWLKSVRMFHKENPTVVSRCWVELCLLRPWDHIPPLLTPTLAPGHSGGLLSPFSGATRLYADWPLQPHYPGPYDSHCNLETTNNPSIPTVLCKRSWSLLTTTLLC